jgi:hypothetical protein
MDKQEFMDRVVVGIVANTQNLPGISNSGDEDRAKRIWEFAQALAMERERIIFILREEKK